MSPAEKAIVSHAVEILATLLHTNKAAHSLDCKFEVGGRNYRLRVEEFKTPEASKGEKK